MPFSLQSLSSLHQFLLGLKKPNPYPISFPSPLSHKSLFFSPIKGNTSCCINSKKKKKIRRIRSLVDTLLCPQIESFSSVRDISYNPLSLFHIQAFYKQCKESFQYLSLRGRHRHNYIATKLSSVVCSYVPKYFDHKCSCRCTSQSAALFLRVQKRKVFYQNYQS